MSKAYKKIVGLEKQNKIRWSHLYPNKDLDGFLGKIKGKFHLALFPSVTGWQLWAVRKDKKKSILIKTPALKMARRAERRCALED